MDLFEVTPEYTSVLRVVNIFKQTIANMCFQIWWKSIQLFFPKMLADG